MSRTAVGLPPELTRRRNHVLRPRDAATVYAHPRAELARLTRTGVLRHIATGYYVLSPPDRWGDGRWIPDINAVALGIAQADYNADVALMGISAARHHGAIPRALAVAIVAVPKQRPALDTGAGRILFVKRDATRLDTERIETQLASGWVTTIEQTLIDLAARPTLGGLAEQDTVEAIRALASRADWDLVQQLARDQHRPSAARTAARLAGDSHA
jgi:predicted transcriptional regulator of viral defense system